MQINNWNEWRKDRAEEKNALIDLYDDFKLNQQEYKDVSEGLEYIMESMVLLLEQSALDSPSLEVEDLNEGTRVTLVLPLHHEWDEND